MTDWAPQAESSAFSATVIGQTFVRCARRLIPLMMLVYLIGWLDRFNIGFAALTMANDLRLSPVSYGLAAGIFFLGYLVFQVPITVLVARTSVRPIIFWSVITWGIVSAAHALVRGPVALYVLRFLLGAAEAGFFPVMIFYLSQWFPEAYRARFTAIFMTAIPLANIVGAPLSGIVLQMDGTAGLKGWQWLFLIEGLPACALAYAVLKFLPESPNEAGWLSAREKHIIRSTLANETARLPTKLVAALRDVRVIGVAFVGFALGFAGYGIGLWLPQVLQSMAYSNRDIGFIIALLSLLGMIAMITWGRASDTSGEREWHIALPTLLAATGLFIISVQQTGALSIAALACIVVGFLAADGPLFSFPSSFLGGAAAAGSVAFINAIGSVGAFAGPFVVGVLKQQSGGYSLAMFLMGVLLFIASVTAVALRHWRRPERA